MQNIDAEGLEGTGRVWEPSVDERSTGCSSEESRTGRSSTAEAEHTSLTLLLVSSLYIHTQFSHPTLALASFIPKEKLPL